LGSNSFAQQPEVARKMATGVGQAKCGRSNAGNRGALPPAVANEIATRIGYAAGVTDRSVLVVSLQPAVAKMKPPKLVNQVAVAQKMAIGAAQQLMLTREW
jgi:hypothetical protein